MKVYALLRLDYDFTRVIDIFSDKEMAEKERYKIEEIQQTWEEWERYEYVIIEKELK